MTSPRLLYEVAAKLIEQVCSAQVTEASGEPEGAEATWLAFIEFKGPSQGRVGLRVTPDAGRALARAFLQEEGEPSDEATRDAVSEIVNIISSSVLAFLFGRYREVEIGTPQIESHDTLALEPVVSVQMLLNQEHRFDVWLTFAS